MVHKIVNKNLKLAYNILMGIFSITICISLIVQSLTELSVRQYRIVNRLDNIIWAIFIIDYFLRLITSKNKIQFVKGNIIDLIAIIPFSTIFQSIRVLEVVKLLDFARILEVLKCLRVLILFLKFQKHVNKFMKTNNFNHMVQFTAVIIFMGAVGLHFAEGSTWQDSLWCSFVTTTTVGYGDISPLTTSGRIIAAILMIVGIGFIGMLTSTISSYFMDKRLDSSNKIYINFKYEIIDSIKRKLDDFENLSKEDIDDICKILKNFKDK